jgi:hypothetical protein
VLKQSMEKGKMRNYLTMMGTPLKMSEIVFIPIAWLFIGLWMLFYPREEKDGNTR